VTNVDQYDRVGFWTGLWLGELTKLLQIALAAGMSGPSDSRRRGGPAG
jgi:hypothetical protein